MAQVVVVLVDTVAQVVKAAMAVLAQLRVQQAAMALAVVEVAAVARVDSLVLYLVLAVVALDYWVKVPMAWAVQSNHHQQPIHTLVIPALVVRVVQLLLVVHPLTVVIMAAVQAKCTVPLVPYASSGGVTVPPERSHQHLRQIYNI
jgi:hypothetical protein